MFHYLFPCHGIPAYEHHIIFSRSIEGIGERLRRRLLPVVFYNFATFRSQLDVPGVQFPGDCPEALGLCHRSLPELEHKIVPADLGVSETVVLVIDIENGESVGKSFEKRIRNKYAGNRLY